MNSNGTANGTIELRDGDALDILADRFRREPWEGEVIGVDLIELVRGLAKETGRPLAFTTATLRNMRAYADRNAEQRVQPPVCLSLSNGETYSATPGDYLDLDDDEVLLDEGGEPMILAVKSEAHGPRDALTGAPIHVEHP